MTTAAAPPVRRARARRTVLGALREVRDARQILANMVRRDFAAKHKNSFFGMAWSLLNPLMLVGVFSFVFWLLGAKVHNDKYPFAVFFFAGLTLWNFFANAVLSASGSIVAGGDLIKKVWFPRDILPLSQVFAALITFAFEFAVLMVVLPFFGIYPYWTLLFVPPIVALTFIVAYGIGLLLSALTVVFRDIEHFIGVFVQVMFFATPIIYDVSLIAAKSERAVTIMKANPVMDLILAYRAAVLDHRPPGFISLVYVFVFGVLSVFIGSRVFNRREVMFAELI